MKDNKKIDSERKIKSIERKIKYACVIVFLFDSIGLWLIFGHIFF